MINKNEAFDLAQRILGNTADPKTNFKIISHITEKSTDQKKQQHRELYKKHADPTKEKITWEIDNHSISVQGTKFIALQMYDEKTTQWNWLLMIPRDSIEIELTFDEVEILQEILDEQLQNLPLLDDQEEKMRMIEVILGKLS